jgi:hypothetical protein
LSYQGTRKVEAGYNPSQTTETLIGYTACCMLGFIHYQLIINLLQSKIRSIKALLFPKKLVLGSAKKRWQTDELFCNFWMSNGSCELQMCLAV